MKGQPHSFVTYYRYYLSKYYSDVKLYHFYVYYMRNVISANSKKNNIKHRSFYLSFSYHILFMLQNCTLL